MSHKNRRNRPDLREVGNDDFEPDWRDEQEAELSKMANGHCEAETERAARQAETIRSLMADLAVETERADAAETILSHRTPRWLFWLCMACGVILGGGIGYLVRILTE